MTAQLLFIDGMSEGGTSEAEGYSISYLLVFLRLLITANVQGGTGTRARLRTRKSLTRLPMLRLKPRPIPRSLKRAWTAMRLRTLNYGMRSSDQILCGIATTRRESRVVSFWPLQSQMTAGTHIVVFLNL